MEFWIPLEEYAVRYRTRHRALYHALKDQVRAGQLVAGIRLPSSRDLAYEYGLSRGTVTQVYEMLAADGILVTSSGRGTFVAAIEAPGPDSPARPAMKPRLSAWARRIPDPPAAQPPDHIRYDLRVGRPDPRIFPARPWRRALNEALRFASRTGPGSPHEPAGLLELREAIAAHLNQRRGLTIAEDNVEIVSGSQQALGLLIQLLINPGDRVVLEDPGYFGTRNAVLAAGGRMLPARVDENGIRIGDWDARLAIVTPSHQFPMGSVLSRERRHRLLQWAVSRNAMLIEDDYDGEFKREGLPVEPLKAMDRDERVVYTGTFSKTIHSGIRLGYVVLPDSLRPAFRRARRLFEADTPARLEQMSLAVFMKSGEYEKHLRRSIRVYRARYQNIIELFDRFLPGVFHWNPSNAGLHIFGVWQDNKLDLDLFTDECAAEGIYWSRPGVFYLGRKTPAALFGYSQLEEDRAEAALEKMGKLYRKLRKKL